MASFRDTVFVPVLTEVGDYRATSISYDRGQQLHTNHLLTGDCPNHRPNNPVSLRFTVLQKTYKSTKKLTLPRVFFAALSARSVA